MTRIALVTGGIRGIGAAISTELSGLGYRVVANYCRQDEIAQKFHKDTGIFVKRFDVSDFHACGKAVDSSAFWPALRLSLTRYNLSSLDVMLSAPKFH